MLNAKQRELQEQVEQATAHYRKMAAKLATDVLDVSYGECSSSWVHDSRIHAMAAQTNMLDALQRYLDWEKTEESK